MINEDGPKGTIDDHLIRNDRPLNPPPSPNYPPNPSKEGKIFPLFNVYERRTCKLEFQC